MNNAEIFSYVDHTLLHPCATWKEIKTLCDEAIKYQTASICIPPSYVARVSKEYGKTVNICTVIGFPLGYEVTEAKVAEVVAAIRDGAAEVDMVINLGDVKNGDFEKIKDEIRALKEAAQDNILKVIIETCYLTENEKVKLCKCVTEAGADYIKTSTGFGTAGATPDDISLFKSNIGSEIMIKAAGGIRTKEDMERFIHLGCKRLGTSSAVKILTGGETDGGY